MMLDGIVTNISLISQSLFVVISGYHYYRVNHLLLLLNNGFVFMLSNNSVLVYRIIAVQESEMMGENACHCCQ